MVYSKFKVICIYFLTVKFDYLLFMIF